MANDQPQAGGEQYISTFFCRALYDYQTNDSSSLSFNKGDIIEVLTRLESGWWDGLLNDERGWFPSNYVTVISDQEAEAALNGSEYPSSQASLPDDSMVDMAHTMSQALSQADDGDWLGGGDVDYQPQRVTGYAPANGASGHVGAQQSDFWVPQVSTDGRVRIFLVVGRGSPDPSLEWMQIFYVNTQTGQQSRDLPTETDGDHEAEVAALSPQVSRADQSTPYGFGGTNSAGHDNAGFGVPKDMRTLGPWIKRLADDGLSYYYLNKLDGTVSWSLPETAAAPPPAYNDDRYSGSLAAKNVPLSSDSSILRNGNSNGTSRLRSESSASHSQDRSDSSADRLSIHSDDSDVHPARRDGSQSSTSRVRHPGNGSAHPPVTASSSSMHSDSPSSHQHPPPALELTAAEESARALQETLSPPSPETAVELSSQVREAITAVLR